MSAAGLRRLTRGFHHYVKGFRQKRREKSRQRKSLRQPAAFFEQLNRVVLLPAWRNNNNIYKQRSLK